MSTPPITDEARTILVTEEAIWIWPIDENGSTAVLHVYPGEFVSLPSEDELPLSLPFVSAVVDTVSKTTRKAAADMCDAEDPEFPVPDLQDEATEKDGLVEAHSWAIPAQD